MTIITTKTSGGVVAQMEAGTLLASAWSWSLQLEEKALGPCVGCMEPKAKEWPGIGMAAIGGYLCSDKDR